MISTTCFGLNHSAIVTYKIDNGFFGSKYVFTITPEHITYQTNSKHITWKNTEVADVKFSTTLLAYNSLGFNVGDQYQLSFLNLNGSVIDLNFSNILSSRKAHAQYYREMITLVKEIFIDKAVQSFLTRIDAGETVAIGRLRINLSGISVFETGLAFSWTELAVTTHEKIFILHKRHAPEFRFQLMFGQWNSETIHQLILLYASRRQKTK